MERLIDENSQSYFYQLRAGWLAYMAGNMSKSVDHYQKAIALRPESIEARIGQMLPLTSLGKYEQVETVAFSTLKLDQHNYTAKSRLAYSLYLSGRFKEAEKYYAELVTQYPSDTTMITGLAWSRLKQGKKKSALEAFYQAREILPGNQQVEEGIALCLSEK
jgi:Flp pilus assembly protein TadD